MTGVQTCALPILRESLAVAAAFEALHDERERWACEARLTEFLHRFGLDESRPTVTASGGERKRAMLALALARQPDLLLLDEPTNHLDIDGITLLEDLLVSGQPKSVILITHDRAFLDQVATRIVELDRGVLSHYPGRFQAYQQAKEAADRKSTRLNSSHIPLSRMPSSA